MTSDLVWHDANSQRTWNRRQKIKLISRSRLDTLHRQPVNSPRRVDLWNVLFSQLLATVLIGDLTVDRVHLWCSHWRSTSGVPLLDTADWKKNSLPAGTLQTPLVHLHFLPVHSRGPLWNRQAPWRKTRPVFLFLCRDGGGKRQRYRVGTFTWRRARAEGPEHQIIPEA